MMMMGIARPSSATGALTGLMRAAFLKPLDCLLFPACHRPCMAPKKRDKKDVVSATADKDAQTAPPVAKKRTKQGASAAAKEDAPAPSIATIPTKAPAKRKAAPKEDAPESPSTTKPAKAPAKRKAAAAKESADPGEAAGTSQAQAPAKRSKKLKETTAAAADTDKDGEGSTAPQTDLTVTGLWLMKNEPEELSLDILKAKPDQTWYWDGVRNYQARNFMRQMKIGDQILFYYSSCKVPGLAGLAKVVKLAYPDHTAWDPKSPYFDAKSTPDNPRWDMVDVQYVDMLPRFITLEELRRHSKPGGMLEGMALFTRFRLSVQPVSQVHWDRLIQLASQQPDNKT